MPSLSEELIQLENILTAALSELSVMKEKAQRLEAENAALIQKFSPYQNDAQPNGTDKGMVVAKTVSEGREALFKLYTEGYHICHPAFGQPRMNNEDCLYCLGVLKNDDVC